MGVITKLLYRGNDLKKGKYKHLFLDMEENIHIHYRDLRIELSRDEFEDIVTTFNAQSEELMSIIEEKNYQDGKLANSNQDETRIWTKSKLKHDVRYHSERISIEDCTDGYHLHLRNYKILLDNDDFLALYKVFRKININQPYAERFDEIIELLYANDVHFATSAHASFRQYNDVQESSAHLSHNEIHPYEIIVATYHEPKIRTIFKKIGFTKSESNLYYKAGLKIQVKILSYEEIVKLTPDLGSQPQILLKDFLQNNQIDHELLNKIQCQILNCINYAKKNRDSHNLDLDFNHWSYKSTEHQTIIPIRPENENAINEIKAYRHWTDFLKNHGLYFKKPEKIKFEKAHQEDLYNNITNFLIEKLVPNKAVAKIYIMGSAARMEMGVYRQPFVHGQWAKLGSDIDLLIEIDESYKEQLPENWKYINQSKTNHCDIYHIGGIQLDDQYDFQSLYPYIRFFHHLFDAYVYYPSKGNQHLKDQFLSKFKAKLIYSKAPTKTENNFHKAIKAAYGQEVKNIAKLNVATENELYRFQRNETLWVLKCFKVSGNYRSSRLTEHAQYEVAIIREMEKRNIPATKLLRTIRGDSLISIEGNTAIAYTYLQGKIFSYPAPDYPIREAAKTLAQYHNEQIEEEFPIQTEFIFDDVFDMWHPQFYRYEKKWDGDKLLRQIFKKLMDVFEELKPIYSKLKLNNNLNCLHNHGDLTPRNFIFADNQGFLFDFQNAFYGPRLLDLADAAFEFCYGGKYPDRNDFNRFEGFINAYVNFSVLNKEEEEVLEDTVKLVGIIKFLKEVRMIKGDENKKNLRRLRAIGLGEFLVNKFE